MHKVGTEKLTPKQRLQKVRADIAQAEARYQRNAQSVRLVGVGKVHSTDAIRAIVEAGLKDIGESYVQEALVKQRDLHDLPITWHFIGHIQSNKTRDIAANFDWVQSVDRVKIAQRLSQHRPAHLNDLNICLQLNLQREASKGGFTEMEIEQAAVNISRLPNLRLRGLMAIPQSTLDFTEQRRTFAQIRAVYKELRLTNPTMDTLSMGMSDDMEAAIAEGATMVRIGTALFGPRQTTSKVAQ